MVSIHVTTPEVSFDVIVPKRLAVLRAIEIAEETLGTISIN